MAEGILYCTRPAANFDLAFTTGHRFQRDEYEYEMEVVSLGELCLPTGKIVAADPGWLDDRVEDYFAKVVPPGTYPVDMALLHTHNVEKKQMYLRTACLRIRFQDAPIAEWWIATTRGQNVENLLPFQIFGYGVDAGMGSFADSAGLAAVLEVYTRQGKTLWDEFYEERILPAFDEEAISDQRDRNFSNVLLDASTGANLIACNSGWGDGVYASYWGLSENGKPVSLVTDFGLLTHEVEATRTLGPLTQLLAEPLHLTLPAGEVTIKIEMPKKRTLILEKSGPGGRHLELKIQDGSKRITPKEETLSYYEDGRRTAKLRFEKPIPAESILVCTYLDHLEPL